MAFGFKIASEFLDRLEGEVEGRSKLDPSDEVRKKIRAFARGELSDNDREEMVVLLKENQSWVPLLAAEVKAMREKKAKGEEKGND